jgi:hypothetical protein
MVPSKVTPSLQLAAHYFIINWARDQNNYIPAVMVAMVATVVISATIKLAPPTMAVCYCHALIV